ncbi:MAG: SDR family oxidoreductase [Alphaproteobacteria bacterium]|nr:SDR family oxidoreductase [Alphaproteobacteria bacterium]
MRLKGKTTIVTGAATGFGSGIARRFAEEGANVVLADINDAEGEKLAGDINGQGGGRARYQRANVTRRAEVDAVVAFAEKTFGGLDVMVANAGIGQRPVPFEQTTEAAYDRLFDVNVKGVFHCCQAALPALRRRGPGSNIIVTVSAVVFTVRPKLVAYAATKGAAFILTRSLALELAAEQIRVNALCPAAGYTPMLAEFMGGAETADVRALWEQAIPMKGLITPKDMGDAAVFLASSEARMVTGVCLPVDGGRTL